ncbi:DNAH7 [Symbiodinium microadriaticum]|nr:DNAH7 [Symbiodinium microadriaticum]
MPLSDAAATVYTVLVCILHAGCLGRGFYLALTNWRQVCRVIQKTFAELHCARFHLEEKFFMETKATELRLRVAQIYTHLLLLVSGPFIAWTIWVPLQGQTMMTDALRWAILTFFAASTLHFMRPGVLSTSTASACYLGGMGMGLVVIYAAMDELRSRESAAAADVHEAAIVPLIFAFFFRVPGVCMTGRLWLIVVCNIALSVVTLAVSPLPSAALELMISLFTFAVAFVLQVALMKAVEREMSFSEAATDLQAATALLQLTCDAVIELDATLRLVEHSDDLAAILLRPGLSLVGTKFEDLLAGPEERRAALQLLRQPRTSGVSSSIVAQAFRTRLVDSCASKFSCESFHVKYQKPDGKTCHLVGLRDVTDQESLARPPTNPQDVREVDHAGKSSKASEQPPDKTPQRIICLQLDLAAWVVECASIPAANLVGMPLAALFPNTGTELLREVLEAARHADPTAEPSLFSFAQVAVQWAPNQLDYIDGTIEILHSQLGALKLLLHCTGSDPAQAGVGSAAADRSQTLREGKLISILPGSAEATDELL